MIIPVECWNVQCDKCGSVYQSGEYVGWNDKGYAEDCATDDDWHKEDDSHYCPNCYDFDDEGEVVV
jgi:hypothetical protein